MLIYYFVSGGVLELTYNFSIYPGGTDYTSLQLEPLTFFSGAQAGDERCHFIQVVDDNILEDSELIFITLSSDEPAFLGSVSTEAVVVINPDPADGEFIQCL